MLRPPMLSAKRRLVHSCLWWWEDCRFVVRSGACCSVCGLLWLPLQRPERAGVAPAEEEEEDAVKQREGEAEEEQEAAERPAHEEGVRAPLCVM